MFRYTRKHKIDLRENNIIILSLIKNLIKIFILFTSKKYKDDI